MINHKHGARVHYALVTEWGKVPHPLAEVAKEKWIQNRVATIYRCIDTNRFIIGAIWNRSKSE